MKRQRASCLTDLAANLRQAGRYAEAREAYGEGLKIIEDLHDLRSQGVVLGQLGALAMQEGNLAEALKRYRAALALFQRLAEPASEAVVWHQLGNAFDEAGQWDEADRHYRESARIKEQQGDVTGAAKTWSNLAVTNEKAGKLEAAERWYRKAIGAFPEEIAANNRATVLYNLADLLRTQPGRAAEARALAEEALAIMKTLDPGATEIWKNCNLLALIAEQEAAGAPDAPRAAALRAEVSAHRRLAHDARRAFPGTRTQLRRFSEEIVTTVLACAGHADAREALAQQQAAMRRPGSDFAPLAAALDRVLAGERDAEALCADLDYDPSMLIEYILEALANPAALQQWMPQGGGAGVSAVIRTVGCGVE